MTLERITLRLYEDDIDLVHWLRSIPAGGRNQALKDMLRLGISASEQGDVLDLETVRQVVREEVAQVTPNLDRGAVRDAIREGLRDLAPGGNDLDFTLSDIRQVMTVVLEQELDRLKLVTNRSGNDDLADDDVEYDAEIDHLLEKLGSSLAVGG